MMRVVPRTRPSCGVAANVLSSKRTSSRDISSKKRAETKGATGYKYLSCSFCGQQMRVPAGKGKIAVKCPSCGEKTIVQS